jgi:hypothetical protein
LVRFEAGASMAGARLVLTPEGADRLHEQNR